MKFKKKERQKLPGEGIHAFVATPAYDGKVETNFAVSLAESCQAAAQMGIKVTATVMGNGAFIDLARNNFAHMFLKSDCTHLFFIDSDLKWEWRGFCGLLLAQKPVVAGAYRKRQEPEEYPLRYLEDDRGGIQMVDGGWIRCTRVATGFLCIERKVVEEMAKEAQKIKKPTPELFDEDIARLFYTDIEDGRFKGEDFAWCDDYVKKYNDYIYVWPDIDFVHAGFPCNWASFLKRKVQEYYGQNDADISQAV